jgi:hypothetical protein
MQAALVEQLDLVLANRAAGVLPGDRRAAGLGLGTELAQIRPYQVGDDVRKLDSAASARTGVPHVRDHVPERTLTTWLLVDVSASMAFGTAERLKSDVAEGVALVIGRLAVRRAGRIGLLTCGAPEPQQMPPTAGRSALVHLRRALGKGVAEDGHAAEDALAQGLRRINRLARGHSLVVVVSDFREGAPGAGSSGTEPGGGSRGLGGRGGAPLIAPNGRARSRLSAPGTTCSPWRFSTRARRSCRTWVTSRSWTPRRAGATRPTPPARSCGAGSPPPSSAAATSSSPPCAAPARATSRWAPIKTG